MGNIIENKYIQSEDSKRKYQPTVDKKLGMFQYFLRGGNPLTKLFLSLLPAWIRFKCSRISCFYFDNSDFKS